MSYVIPALFAVFALAMTYLIWTKRVHFPLLFETGMGLLALGAALIGEAVKSGVSGIDMAWRGLPLTIGALLVWASSRREKKKRARSEPRDMTNEAMRHVRGGKK